MGAVRTELLLEKISAGFKTINFRLTLPEYSDSSWQMYAPLDKDNPIGFFDITKSLQEFAKKFVAGSMKLQSPHTTMRILVNEKEEGYLKDRVKHLQKKYPAKRDYEHNKNHYPPSCKNGHAHLMADIFPAVQEILIKNGSLNLGKYISILTIDLYPLEVGNSRYVDVFVSGVPLE